MGKTGIRQRLQGEKILLDDDSDDTGTDGKTNGSGSTTVAIMILTIYMEINKENHNKSKLVMEGGWK